MLSGEFLSVDVLPRWWKMRPPLGKLLLPNFHQPAWLNDHLVMINIYGVHEIIIKVEY